MHHYRAFKGGPLFFGGSPQIDGGMTEEQYAKLQLEERQWQQELQDQNYARAQAAEERRLAQEGAHEDRLRAQENAEQAAIQAAQMSLNEELDAQEEAEEDNSFGAIDFYGALSQGQNSDPATIRPE